MMDFTHSEAAGGGVFDEDRINRSSIVLLMGLLAFGCVQVWRWGARSMKAIRPKCIGLVVMWLVKALASLEAFVRVTVAALGAILLT